MFWKDTAHNYREAPIPYNTIHIFSLKGATSKEVGVRIKISVLSVRRNCCWTYKGDGIQMVSGYTARHWAIRTISLFCQQLIKLSILPSLYHLHERTKKNTLGFLTERELGNDGTTHCKECFDVLSAAWSTRLCPEIKLLSVVLTLPVMLVIPKVYNPFQKSPWTYSHLYSTSYLKRNQERFSSKFSTLILLNGSLLFEEGYTFLYLVLLVTCIQLRISAHLACSYWKWTWVK